MLVKKVLARPADAVKKDSDAPEAPVMTEAEMDKTIEELVIE